jgi:threonine/homoserine/homoserine lactone efflux protein
MPSLETIVAVTLAGLALSASPGPSMLYVLSRSVGQSRAAGLVSAAGLAVGGIALALAAALGLAATVNLSPTLYALIRTAGGLYLIYLGLSALWDIWAREPDLAAATRRMSKQQPLGQIFLQGVMVELLNPKTIIFFLAFLPQFVDSTRGSITTQMLLLGALVPLTAVPSDIIVAYSGGTLAKKVASNRRTSIALQCLSAAVLIALGVRIFVDF